MSTFIICYLIIASMMHHAFPRFDQAYRDSFQSQVKVKHGDVLAYLILAIIWPLSFPVIYYATKPIDKP